MHAARRVEHLIGLRSESRVQHFAVCDAFIERARDCGSLLVNFFLHVVPELAAFGGIGRQLAFLDGPCDLLTVAVKNRHLFPAHDSHVSLVEEHELPCHRQQGGNIRCDEVLTYPQTDDNRTTHSRQYKCPRIVRAQDRECVSAFQFGNGRPNRCREIL